MLKASFVPAAESGAGSSTALVASSSPAKAAAAFAATAAVLRANAAPPPADSCLRALILRLRATSRLRNCAEKRFVACCLRDSVSVCIQNNSVLVSDILCEEVEMTRND